MKPAFHSAVTPLAAASALPLGGGREVILGRMIARGGACSVFESRFLDGGLERRAAAKLFDLVSEDELGSALKRRSACARDLAWNDHPNIVRPMAVASPAVRQVLLLEELVSGVSLRGLLEATGARGDRLSLDLVLTVAIGVADALSAAWHGVGPDGRPLHRAHEELTTGHVLLSTRGEVKVTGFGASSVGSASGVRFVGSLRTRFETASPEVAMGSPADQRSDVFSLGVVLMRMLGAKRFPEKATDSDLAAMAAAGFVQPALFGPQLPEELRAVIRRATNVEPWRRYAAPDEMAYDLRRIAYLLGASEPSAFLRRAVVEALPRDDEPTV